MLTLYTVAGTPTFATVLTSVILPVSAHTKDVIFPIADLISKTSAASPSSETPLTVISILSAGVDPPTEAPRIVIISSWTYPIPPAIIAAEETSPLNPLSTLNTALTPEPDVVPVRFA